MGIFIFTATIAAVNATKYTILTPQRTFIDFFPMMSPEESASQHCKNSLIFFMTVPPGKSLKRTAFLRIIIPLFIFFVNSYPQLLHML